jgi:hypothetical protein
VDYSTAGIRAYASVLYAGRRPRRIKEKIRKSFGKLKNIINFAFQSAFKMNKKESQLNDLKEIRQIMERSSRFVSLSGLSGVAAGVCGLASAVFTHWYLSSEGLRDTFESRAYIDVVMERRVITNLLLIGFITLALAVGSASFFTLRKSFKTGIKVWDATTRRLFINMALPLVSGGIFCLALLKHEEYGLVAPATLVFYGLALLNASKYTLDDLRYLGVIQIVLGLVAMFYEGYGLEFWALGFGVSHIIYGTVMWYKYDRKG